MKLYLTKDEVQELEDTDMLFDNYVNLNGDVFNYPLNTMVFRANRMGYPFSIVIDKTYTVEAMYNGGVLIRPYDSNVDFALQNYERYKC